MKFFVISTVLILFNQMLVLGQFIYNVNQNIDIYGKYVTDTQIENIKYSVKKIIEHNYYAKIDNEKITKAGRLSKNIGQIYSFDKNGNSVERLEIEDSTDISKTEMKERKTLSYDETGKLNTIITEGYFNFDNRTYIYKYDKRGRIVKLTSLKPNGKTNSKKSFKYNSKSGRLVSSILNGYIDYSYKYEFTELPNGNLECLQYEDNKKHQTLVFDSNGKLLKKTKHVKRYSSMNYMSSGGNVEIYTYDEHGNITSKKEISILIRLNANEKPKYSYEYEYDEKFNWIRQIEFQDNEPVYIIEREIEYFK